MPSHTLVFGDRKAIELRYGLSRKGARLEFRSRTESRTFKLAVRTDAKPSLSHDPGAHWSMVRGLGTPNEIFMRPVTWAYRAMYSYDGYAPLPMERAWARATMRRLYDLIREIACHAADTCSPKARAIALRFCPHLRFRVYKAIVQDPSGRIAQLATAAPGVLIFALGLLMGIDSLSGQRNELRRASDDMLAGVIAGRPLKQVLALGLEAWAEAVEAMTFCANEEGKAVAPMWKRIAGATLAERGHLLGRQRLLLRRSGPRVPTTLLLLPPPLAFAPEDIPRKVRANAAWYRVMKGGGGTLSPVEGLTAEQHAICMFLSKNAVAVAHRLRQCRRSSPNLLMRYLEATGRFPSRKSAAAPFLEEVLAWHRDAPARYPERPVALSQELLPRLPVAPPQSARFSATPLSSATALRTEGQEMSHCVGDCAYQAASGSSYFYSVRCGLSRLTMELVRRGDWNLELGELAGPHNRAPTSEELALAAAAVASMQRELRAPVPF